MCFFKLGQLQGFCNLERSVEYYYLRSILWMVCSQDAAIWFKAFVVLAMYVLISANVF